MPARTGDDVEVGAAEDADGASGDRSADSPGAHPDGGDQPIPGGVALVFALAAPQAVLVVGATERSAVDLDVARGAHVTRRGFATLAGLRSLGR